MSIESVMPFNHLMLCCSLLLLPSIFPSINLFQWVGFFTSGGQSTGASASLSVLPVNTQGWFPLGWTGSPCSPRDSQESSPAQFQSISSLAVTLPYGLILKSVHDYWKNHSSDCMDLCWQSNVSVSNLLSRFVIAFLPRSKGLLILWLQSPSTAILEPKKIKFVTVSTFSPSICHEMIGLDGMIFVFWMLSFKPGFSTLLFHLHQEALQFLFAFCH